MKRYLTAAGLLITAILPASAVSLEEALDGAGLTWTTSGEESFEGVEKDGAAGGDLALAKLNNGETAKLLTTVNGPGVFDFFIGGEAPAVGWSASIDGVALDLSSGQWPDGFEILGAGEHAIEIIYQSGVPEVVEMFVDAVSFIPTVEVTVEGALDTSGRTWITTGPWRGRNLQSSGNDSDGDALQGSPLEVDDIASLETVVEGPAEISFWWTHSANSRTRGSFLINGVHRREVKNGYGRWRQITIALGDGSHTLRWEVEKYGNPTHPSHVDGMWMDRFTTTPLSSGNLATIGTPLPGAHVIGWSSAVAPGFDGETEGGAALALYSQQNETVEAIWPFAPAAVGTGLRKLSFWAKGTSWISAELGDYGRSLRVNGTQEWQKVETYLLPEIDQVKFTSLASSGGISVGVIDGLQIEDVETTPAGSALGPLASDLTSNGWYEWASLDDATIKVAGSVTSKSTLSGTVEGPGWLRFDGQVEEFNAIVLSLDSVSVMVVDSEEMTSFEMLIPDGRHTINFIHLAERNLEPFASLANVRLEPIETVSIGEALGVEGLTFDTSESLSNHRSDPQVVMEDEPFIAVAGEGIIGQSTNSELLILTTEVTGPALVSFCWREEEDYQEAPYSWVTPPNNLGGTEINIVGEPSPFAVSDFSINGIQAALLNDYLFASPAELPFDPAAPNRTPEGLTPILTRSQFLEDGWVREELYLTKGTHTLRWQSGIRPLEDYSSWRRLSLKNLKVSAVTEEFAQWSAAEWNGDPDSPQAATFLGPWQDPAADLDGDGATNAMEFAYRTDPQLASSFPQESIARIINGQMTAIWPGLILNDGLTLKPQVSRNLRSWTDEVTSSEAEGIFQATPSTPMEKAFFRLTVDVTE